MPTPVDRLHEDFTALIEHLTDEPSLRSVADDSFRKSILLAAASYFEARLSETVESFVTESSNASPLITSLVKKKVIARQYHTWFNWEGRNANSFYKLFGDEFAAYMKARHDDVDWLDSSVNLFLELGRSRNLLIHENFAAFVMEKTAVEIYQAYLEAARFVDAIPDYLRQCNFEAVRAINAGVAGGP